jgi:hypothetical protein
MARDRRPSAPRANPISRQGRVQDTAAGNSSLTVTQVNFTFVGSIGGHSSMVEPQIVVLDVAGSSPVGHPIS